MLLYPFKNILDWKDFFASGDYSSNEDMQPIAFNQTFATKSHACSMSIHYIESGPFHTFPNFHCHIKDQIQSTSTTFATVHKAILFLET